MINDNDNNQKNKISKYITWNDKQSKDQGTEDELMRQLQLLCIGSSGSGYGGGLDLVVT